MISDTMVLLKCLSYVSWELGVPDLTEVKLRVIDSAGDPIDGSPFEATEHPTIPGVYQVQLKIEEAGTYFLRWTSEAGTLVQDTGRLFVVSSPSGVHNVTFHVLGEDNLPIPDLEIVMLQLEDTEYVVVSSATTSPEGYAGVRVPDGTFVIWLRKSGYVFNKNISRLEVVPSSGDYGVPLSLRAIQVPDYEYTAPTTIATMSVKLLRPDGTPDRYRTVQVTALGPAQYSLGEDFIVSEGIVQVRTDMNGQAQVRLAPGVEVIVTIEGSRFSRKFTVPQEDFSLYDYLGTASAFDVVIAPYQEVEPI